MEGIIGHEAIIDFFARVRANASLGHAYCFVGPEHVGRRRVAEGLAADVLKVTPAKLRVIPDYMYVGQEMNEKTGKTKKDIDIDQIRRLREMMGMRSYLGGYKVGIIDGAERLNTHASNALLKTLEEPGKATLLILLASDEAELPETIRSRCQMVYFHRVDTQQIATALTGRGVSEKNAEETARFSLGLPGLALAWSADNEVYEVHRQEIVRFSGLLGKSFSQKIKAVEDLFESGDDHIAARLRLKDVLSLWQVLMRDAVVREKNDSRSTYQLAWPHALSVPQYLSLSARMEEAKGYLEQNIHPRLLLEPILLHIP